MRTHIASGLIAVGWLLGCAATPIVPSNTREEDQSATAHRNEAAQHRAHAQEESRDTTGMAGSRADLAGDTDTSDEAAAQQREAAVHERNAADLQRTMETDCVNVPVRHRTECSLGTHRASAVDDMANGVVIRFAPGGDELQTTLSRIHCTHAYADYAGRDTMSACVLAVRDLTIEGHDDHGSIVLTLTTAHRPSLGTLQSRAHALMAAPASH